MQSEFERKRLRSRLSSSGSESERAQPYYKQPKMTEITELMPPSSAADGDSGPVEGNAISGELKLIKDSLRIIRSDQTLMKQSLESSLESFRLSVTQTLNQQFKMLEERIDNETSVLVSRLDDVEARIARLEQKPRDPFDPEVTIVATGIKSSPNEDIQGVAEKIVKYELGLMSIAIVRTIRLGQRDGRSGIVKIEFKTAEDKIKVLKNKQKLKESTEYNRVFLRSSLSHSGRLIQLNFKTILEEIPNGGNYRVTGSGRLVRKQPFSGKKALSPENRPYVSQNLHRTSMPLLEKTGLNSHPDQQLPSPKHVSDMSVSAVCTMDSIVSTGTMDGIVNSDTVHGIVNRDTMHGIVNPGIVPRPPYNEILPTMTKVTPATSVLQTTTTPQVCRPKTTVFQHNAPQRQEFVYYTTKAQPPDPRLNAGIARPFVPSTTNTQFHIDQP